MKQKKKQSLRRIIGNVMVGVGAALIVVGVGYELAIYPWRIVLQSVGVEVAQELPEPKPLPKMTGTAAAPSAEESGILPENAGLFAARPELNLMQLGSIQIGKIGISENIVEGVGEEMLYAVGHMPGTPLPGQGGNSVLAAHRDYVRMNPFRHLDKVQPGDVVRIRVEDDLFYYEVTENFVVNPTDIYVTHPQQGRPELLTLITCTPVLTSTHRMIVWASLREVHLNVGA